MVVGDGGPKTYGELQGYFNALEDENILSSILIGNSPCIGEIYLPAKGYSTHPLRLFIERFGKDRKFYNLVLSRASKTGLSGFGARADIQDKSKLEDKLTNLRERFPDLSFYIHSD